jgi:hypothetical protein
MLFRFLAALLFLIGLLAFVSDITPAISGGEAFVATALADHWKMLVPASFDAAERWVTNTPVGFVWNAAIAPFLKWPTFAVLGGLALIFGFLGRRRRRIKIFAN